MIIKHALCTRPPTCTYNTVVIFSLYQCTCIGIDTVFEVYFNLEDLVIKKAQKARLVSEAVRA